jgi:hypothetical protein
MNMLDITLFGKVQLRRGDIIIADIPARVQECLLYLLLHRAQPHNRERLADVQRFDDACVLVRDVPGLAELEQKQRALRETMLRISGAIQVLEEELGKAEAQPAAVDGGISDEKMSISH